jgi:hypothetical protein
MYVPNNDAIFIAAYSGAMAGMCINRGVPLDNAAIDYGVVAMIAGAWAQSFDTSWGANSNSPLDANLALTLSEQAWSQRTPGPQNIAAYVTASNWKAQTDALVAQITASETYFAGQGINPNPTNSNPSWKQATWFIDPQNVTGLASNRNSGLDSTHPLLTFGEILSRWGTSTPLLSGFASCTITFLSGHLDTTDPVICAPFCDGVLFSIQGSLPTPTGTGALSGLVAKNIPTNQALNANLPAGTLPGSLIINTTRANSYARAFKNLGGSLWLISQPIAATAVPFTGNPTQNNAWANTDNVNVYSPSTQGPSTANVYNINIVLFAPVITNLNGGFNNVPHLANLNISDLNAGAFGFDTAQLGGGVIYLNCSSSKRLELNASLQAIANTRFTGCDIGQGLNGGSASQLTVFMAGQYRLVNNGWPIGAQFDCDFVFAGQVSAYDAVGIGGFGLGTVYVDGGFIKPYATFGIMSLHTTYNSGQAAVYGSGGVDVKGALYYLGTAVNSFPCAGGLKITGSANAYSNATSGGVVTTHLLAITPAALDAAAGAAGFGGLAYIPGGGSIGVLSATP